MNITEELIINDTVTKAKDELDEMVHELMDNSIFHERTEAIIVLQLLLSDMLGKEYPKKGKTYSEVRNILYT
jgi:hypothetical protein